MITLELTKEEAVEFLFVLAREQKDYTHDPSCTPASIVRVRNMMHTIDKKLDEMVQKEFTEESDG